MPATYGVGADAVSYTSAISGCERAGEWMAAAQLLRQMRDAGVSPTMRTYSEPTPTLLRTHPYPTPNPPLPYPEPDP